MPSAWCSGSNHAAPSDRSRRPCDAWSTVMAWIAKIDGCRYVTPVTRPGQPPEQVRLFDLEGATQGFPLAVDALDAAVHLSDLRAGARLLVVVSDGEFTDEERRDGQARLDRLTRSGCGLLWLGPPRSTPLNGAQTTVLGDPADAGRAIARAATAALRRT